MQFDRNSNRRMLLAGLIALPVAGVLSSGAAAQQLTPFKIGISAPVVTILPVWMAETAGFYAKEGLKVEVINMEGGTRGVQVLLSGEIQAMHVGLAVVAQANQQGADIRLINSSSNTLPMTIFTKPDIKTPAQLKGKTFGISTFGSETDIAISIFLQQNGMTRQDVTISQLGGSSQRYNALVAGRIDAALLLEPTTTMAKAKGFNPMLDLAAAKTPWIFDGVVVTRDYLNKNRDTLTKFVRAYVEAARLMLSNEAKAKELISQRFKTQDTAVIDATYADFKRLMPPDSAPSVEGAKNVLAQLQAVKIDIGSKDVKDYVDDSIIQKLRQDGFFTQMDKEFPVK